MNCIKCCIFFCLIFFTIISSISANRNNVINITKVVCINHNNSIVARGGVCEVKPLNKTTTLIRMNCILLKEINEAIIRIRILQPPTKELIKRHRRKLNRTFTIDTYEDFCAMTGQTLPTGNFYLRFIWPFFRKATNIMQCPIKNSLLLNLFYHSFEFPSLQPVSEKNLLQLDFMNKKHEQYGSVSLYYDVILPRS